MLLILISSNRIEALNDNEYKIKLKLPSGSYNISALVCSRGVERQASRKRCRRVQKKGSSGTSLAEATPSGPGATRDSFLTNLN